MDSGLPAAVALPRRCPPVSDGVLSAEIAVDPANALFKIARRPRHAIVHGPITEEVQINDFPNGIGANHDVRQSGSIELLDRTFMTLAVTGNTHDRIQLMQEIEVFTGSVFGQRQHPEDRFEIRLIVFGQSALRKTSAVGVID